MKEVAFRQPSLTAPTLWAPGQSRTASVKTNTILTLQVSAGTNDGFARGATLDTAHVYLRLGYYSGTNQEIFLLFSGATIPKAATILSAKLQYRVETRNINGSNSTIIYGNKVDSAVVPISVDEYSAKTRTTASVIWVMPDANVGDWCETSDITPVIQEIVNGAGWESGNSLMILHKNNSGTDYRQYCAYEYTGNASGAKLVIEHQ